MRLAFWMIVVSALSFLNGVSNTLLSVNAAPLQAEESADVIEALGRCFINGFESRVRCAEFNVPLDYDDPSSRKLNIYTAVLPARGSQRVEDPLFVFAGGPGQAAAEFGALVKLAFRRIRDKRDIILIDQRGTGKSFPLECEGNEAEVSFEQMQAFVEECRKDFDIDVSHFTQENFIRDVDEVRKRLGYDKINLWGVSFGTRNIALYLRRYPENVRSIIVDGVLPPDVALFKTVADSAQRAMTKLLEDCAHSEACNKRYADLAGKLDALMDKAQSGDLFFKGINPATGEAADLKLTFPMAVESLRSVMYSADAAVTLPLVIDTASKGNLGPLVSSLYSTAGSGLYLGATLSILCGEEVERVSVDEVKEAGKNSFAGDSYYQIWSNACKAWDYKRPSPDIYEPIKSDVPALVLSGDLDPITPPPLGEHLAKTFANGRHIVVKGTGHNTSYIGCMPRLINEFIDTLDASALDTDCLDHLKRLPIVTDINGSVN